MQGMREDAFAEIRPCGPISDGPYALRTPLLPKDTQYYLDKSNEFRVPTEIHLGLWQSESPLNICAHPDVITRPHHDIPWDLSRCPSLQILHWDCFISNELASFDSQPFAQRQVKPSGELISSGRSCSMIDSDAELAIGRVDDQRVYSVYSSCFNGLRVNRKPGVIISSIPHPMDLGVAGGIGVSTEDARGVLIRGVESLHADVHMSGSELGGVIKVNTSNAKLEYDRDERTRQRRYSMKVDSLKALSLEVLAPTS